MPLLPSQSMLGDVNRVIGLLDARLKKFSGTFELTEDKELEVAIRETARHHRNLALKNDNKLFARLTGDSDDPIHELGRKRLQHLLAAHGNMKRHIEAVLKREDKPNALRRLLPAYAR